MRIVYVNHASKKELTAIPGVGPVTAEKITRERKVKPFRDLFDLAERIDHLNGWHLLIRASDMLDFGPQKAPECPEKKVSIDVNGADVDRLRLIPNVGQVTADRIIQERKKRPFTDASDLVDRIDRLGFLDLSKLDLFFWEPENTSLVLDVNQAEAVELMIRLDVDQFTAEEIIKARNKRPFTDLSDIADRVEGVEYGQLIDLGVEICFDG